VRLMPLRVPVELGDDFANELYVLGLSIPSINRMFDEIRTYTSTLTQKEMQQRARDARKIRKG